MPCESQQELAEDAFATLSNIISRADGKQIILIGDFNAHIEGYGGAGNTNSNGEKLLELIEYWELGIVNDPRATTLYHNPNPNSQFCVDYTIVSDGIDFDQES